MQVVVQFALINELGVVGVDRFYFDRNLQVCFGIDSLVDLAKSALVDFADDFEVLSDFLDHLWHGLRVFGVGIRISGMFNLNCNLLFYLFSDDD